MKMLIIGVGFLAQYLIPCYEGILGEDLSDKVIGIKASSRDIENTRKHCPFPIQVQGTEETLRAFEPDMITIGVRPQQVVEVVKKDLIPYFKELREAGKKLPIIYSLAPDPTIDYFYDTLGSDVKAVYQFPNVIKEINGIDVSQVGVSFVTFDKRAKWEKTDYDMAMNFLAPTGKVFEIDAEKASPYLSVQSTTHLMFDIIGILQDTLHENGKEVEYAQIASAIRTMFRPLFHEPCVEVVPCDAAALEDSLKQFLQRFVFAWYEGLLAFTQSEKIPDEAAIRNICGSIESYNMQAQLQSREELTEATKSHATPGGYLEMALKTFYSKGAQYLKETFADFLKGEKIDAFDETMKQITYEIIFAVSEHGKSVGGVKK